LTSFVNIKISRHVFCVRFEEEEEEEEKGREGEKKKFVTISRMVNPSPGYSRI
jgi:hypothetical protein